MKRFGWLFLMSLVGLARADDTRVRATTTVEVLDDQAQVDDVISRIERERKEARPKESDRATSLQRERPPLPLPVVDPARRAAEIKEKPPGSRRPNRERNGNPDHTERPRPRRR